MFETPLPYTVLFLLYQLYHFSKQSSRTILLMQCSSLKQNRDKIFKIILRGFSCTKQKIFPILFLDFEQSLSLYSISTL